ncbi:class I SAM-dependent methyltransferase [Pseudonocardia yuanmonensis]|uniref:Class I SAM-dependent methyltransferase n=1 Tax=Pseudonocardia yuanmonensis TaxID=1095914 RepID=A0ABP8X7K9_9PSEU
MERTIDGARLEEFLGLVVQEVGAAYNAVLTAIGDELGLYDALAAGPLTPQELACRTGTAERYIREWLSAQAASGFVRYDTTAQTFELPPEQAHVLADRTSPVYLPGLFQAAKAVFAIAPRIADGFRTGKGVGWHEHGRGLFEGTERFFRAGYRANLVPAWIPALDGIEAKLRAGAQVADVGCGYGASTIIMAAAYPNSTFVGVDYHPASVEAARRRAAEAHVSDRVRFEVASAVDYAGTYDLVACFDCLHDMGDPVAAARHVLESLAPDGAWMIVEPRAGDRIEDNLHPVGRLYYAASTMICTPAALAQDGGTALGAQAGRARLEEVIRTAGFTAVREVAVTPFNVVLEARP